MILAVSRLRHRVSLARRRTRSLQGNVTVGPGFEPGHATRIWAPTSLQIGHSFFIGSYCRVEVDGVIGDAVLMSSNVAVVGASDHAINEVGTPITETTWVGDRPDLLSRSTRIGSDVWIGYGAIILSGVSIGDSAIVGAGSLVTRDVPPNTIVVGSPAVPLRQRFDDEQLAAHWEQLRKRGIALSTT